MLSHKQIGAMSGVIVATLLFTLSAYNQRELAREQRHSFCVIRETRLEAYEAYKVQLAQTPDDAPVSPFIPISQHERLRLIKALDYLHC